MRVLVVEPHHEADQNEIRILVVQERPSVDLRHRSGLERPPQGVLNKPWLAPTNKKKQTSSQASNHAYSALSVYIRGMHNTRRGEGGGGDGIKETKQATAHTAQKAYTYVQDKHARERGGGRGLKQPTKQPTTHKAHTNHQTCNTTRGDGGEGNEVK